MDRVSLNAPWAPPDRTPSHLLPPRLLQSSLGRTVGKSMTLGDPDGNPWRSSIPNTHCRAHYRSVWVTTNTVPGFPCALELYVVSCMQLPDRRL